MKNRFLGIGKYFTFGLIIFAMLFIVGCTHGDNSDPFANNGNSDENDNHQSSIGALSTILDGLFNSGTSTPIDLNAGIVAYYPFNGNANDESGNGHNGTVNGATLTQDRDGNPNSAYHFDGATSGIYCNVGNEMSLSYVTLAAWINIEGSGTENPRIVAVNQNGTSSGYYALLMAGTASPRSLSFQAQPDLYYSSSTLSDNNGWHHVALTYDGSHVTFYVDGVADPALSANHSSLASFTNAVLNIGYSDNGLDRFNGDIDEVRIYNRALSANEILALYNQQ